MPSSRRSRRRPYSDGHVPLDPDRLRSVPRSETGPDGSAWTVRQVRGSDKEYRCPGCDQIIPAGTAHVVAWQSDHLLGEQAGLDSRRHWHSSCWRARGHRRPTR